MKINRITVTGADESIAFKDLFELSEEFPFVEWGILFSILRAGTRRYPPLRWIENLCQSPHRSENFKLSAHLCGQYPRDILQKGKLQGIDLLVKNYFQRAQINFNFSNTEWKSEYLLNLLKDNNTQYILQMNKSNADIIKTIVDTENFDVLYDSSGGRGTEIKEIQPPISGHYTGYSGGLGPNNIDEFCKKIIKHPSPNSVFIDCETGVRNDKDEFDLVKVREYLIICSKYVAG